MPTDDDRDRIRGALLGLAVGDALGAPLEATTPAEAARAARRGLEMTGGRGWAPGEWTDDTAMALALAESIAVRGVLDWDIDDQGRIGFYRIGNGRDAAFVLVSQAGQIIAEIPLGMSAWTIRWLTGDEWLLVGLGEYGGVVFKHAGASLLVIGIRKARAGSGPGLDEHLMSTFYELIRSGRWQRDAKLLLFNFFGNADDHGFSPAYVAGCGLANKISRFSRRMEVQHRWPIQDEGD